jgi:GNAT superfamily N-acetyltransferase
MVLASIAAGNTLGRLWQIPQRSGNPLVLLWDGGNNVFCLAGESHNPSSLGRLADVISTQALPQVAAEGVEHFKVRALETSLEAHLPQLFTSVPLQPSPSLFFVHDRAWNPENTPAPGAGTFRLLPIRAGTLVGNAYDGSQLVLDEIHGMWPSEARFYEHGFGELAIRDGEILCWCTAEYVGPSHCGIGIATKPESQRRGIATATAAAFVQEARARGLTPCWECSAANLPSRRVAEKLGFVHVETCTYWIGSPGGG